MTWRQIVPAPTQPIGEREKSPTAKMDKHANLNLNVGTVRLLGTPSKVQVFASVELLAIRLKPTTPDDKGGFVLSGGGNTSYRVRLKKLISSNEEFLGDYEVRKIAEGIELRKKSRTAQPEA